MKGSPWSDGVPGVTQKPIPPKGSFTYKFKATQYGSYWYHGHQLGHMEDGLLGAIVIHPKKDQATPFSKITSEASELKAIAAAVADPYPLVISDWRHRTADEIVKITHDAGMEIPCFDAILFNGKGSVNCLDPNKLKHPNASSTSLLTPQQALVLATNNVTSFTSKGCLPPQLIAKTISPKFPTFPEKIPADVLEQCKPTNGPQETIEVKKGKETAAYIAIDVIGALSLITGVCSIDEHEPWVYAVDGEFIVPQKVSAFQITNGDRFSILVKLTTEGKYPLRFASTQNSQILVSAASIVYGKAGSKTTTPWIKENGLPASPSAVFFSQAKQKQLEPKTIPLVADKTTKMFIRSDGRSYEWALNGSAYPAAVLDHHSADIALFKPNFNANDNVTISTKSNLWHDLIIITATKPTPPHPIHKHGNKMWQIGAGIGEFKWADVKEAVAAVPQNFNLVDPPRRDGFLTAQATPVNATWTVLRYHASEPGPWLLHCHVQSHLFGGMSVLLQDGIDNWPTVPKSYADY